jgi:hypothetical protein
MLAVLETTLQPFVTCEFDVEKPLDGLPRRRLCKTLSGPALEEYVPARPVSLPEIRRLADAQALAEARSSVAAALDDLGRAERALADRLAGLRQYMDRTVSGSACV